MDYEFIENNILKSFHEKKNSHAFLLCTNNINRCYDEVINMIKVINCKNGGNDDCNICSTISSGNNPDVIVIEPDGKEIKKESVEILINRFSTKPLINDYSIYVIKNADKLNGTSANKLLKFLEEPSGNIVGFFITDKLDNVLNTIKSRCQISKFNFGNETLLDELELSEEEYGKYFNVSSYFVGLLNNSPKYILINEGKKLLNYERSEIEIILNLIKRVYTIKYEFLFHKKDVKFDGLLDIINLIETDDLYILIDRISILNKYIDIFQTNVNEKLFFYRLFIEWR